MAVAAPLALIALLPWGLLAWWLFRARGTPSGVPFLFLWPRNAAMARARSRQVPPPAVLLALAALLLAVVAASRPELSAGGRSVVDIVVIVDRGATMSAEAGGMTRLDRFLLDYQDVLAPADDASTIRFVPPDTQSAAAAPDLYSRADRAGPSAMDTSAALREAVAGALAGGGGVLLISDRPIPRNSRVFQIGPQDTVHNTRMNELGPDGPSVLVTLSSTGPQQRATLMVESGTQRSTREVALPGSGRETQLAVRLPAGAADFVKATVSSEGDAWPGDNTLVIARERAWPALEVDADVPPPVQRVAQIYSDLRPPRSHSRRISIGVDQEGMDAVLAPANQMIAAEGELQVQSHALTQGTDWKSLEGVRAGSYPFSQDGQWRALVMAGRDVLLAATDSAGRRRAWIGFTADQFEQTPDFVRFWSDLLTWLNGGPEQWGWRHVPRGQLRSLSLEEALASVRVDDQPGGPVAWILPPVEFGKAPAWSRDRLTDWLALHERGAPLWPWVLLAALLAACGAAWLWPRRAAA